MLAGVFGLSENVAIAKTIPVKRCTPRCVGSATFSGSVVTPEFVQRSWKTHKGGFWLNLPGSGNSSRRNLYIVMDEVSAKDFR
jgi:hypothetical protein